MGLRALLLICCGVVSVSALLLPPRDLTIASQNFKHILTWRDPNNVTSIFYRVMVSSMFLEFVDATDCSNITTPRCDLSKDLTEINDSYRVRVSCFTDQDSSKPSSSVSLTPVQNTVLGPPIVDIGKCDRGIQVSIQPPVSYLWSEDKQQYVSMVSHEVFPRMNCRIMVQNNTVVSFQDEHISKENTTFTYTVLPNTIYCVSVIVTASSNSRPLKPPIPSKVKCVLTDNHVSDSSTVYIIVSVVGGVLLLVGLVMVLCVLDKVGLIGSWKTGIPKVLKSLGIHRLRPCIITQTSTLSTETTMSAKGQCKDPCAPRPVCQDQAPKCCPDPCAPICCPDPCPPVVFQDPCQKVDPCQHQDVSPKGHVCQKGCKCGKK